eukprot:scaffold22532_cov93-Cylindrotheca_fusiformis.AAC.6
MTLKLLGRIHTRSTACRKEKDLLLAAFPREPADVLAACLRKRKKEQVLVLEIGCTIVEIESRDWNVNTNEIGQHKDDKARLEHEVERLRKATTKRPSNQFRSPGNREKETFTFELSQP